jgi:hypothetical protein
MRKTFWIVVILVVAWSAYVIWPVVGFYRIVAAVESRNAAALSQLVDFRHLRKSLTKQLLATYLKLTGKEKKLGLLGKSIAMGVGSSIVEPIVARLVNEETLMDLLTKGSAGGAAKVPGDLIPFSENALRSGWQTWWKSEYGLGEFFVRLPPDKSADEQFKVKLSLASWQWKLSSIDLPDQLRVQLVQEILKKQEKGEVP